jgi:hypothetical protein
MTWSHGHALVYSTQYRVQHVQYTLYSIIYLWHNINICESSLLWILNNKDTHSKSFGLFVLCVIVCFRPCLLICVCTRTCYSQYGCTLEECSHECSTCVITYNKISSHECSTCGIIYKISSSHECSTCGIRYLISSHQCRTCDFNIIK